MGSLTSDSTRADVAAAIKNNMAYAVDGSVAQCKAFIEAAAHWLFFYAPQRQRLGDAEVQLDTGALRHELDKARAWLAANAPVTEGGAGVRHRSLEDFRV